MKEKATIKRTAFNSCMCVNCGGDGYFDGVKKVCPVCSATDTIHYLTHRQWVKYFSESANKE